VAKNQYIFQVDRRFFLASNRVIDQQDCVAFDHKMVAIEHVTQRYERHDSVERSDMPQINPVGL
jgi:hypothetical protein